MSEHLRWFWARLNANYWFYPALFALLAVVLALVLVQLDRTGLTDWLHGVAWIVPARPESASNMLQVIAASMIGVASTVFSITIAAVVYASGNYGPRLLTNFMEDRGNQLSLAVFIGTFVYALTVLRTVRGEDETASNAAEAATDTLPGFVPQLSLLVAYLLMALSVAVLVFFLNHIPSCIRINTVLKGIGRRLIEEIEEDYPEPAGREEPVERPRGTPLLAEANGYVQFIAFEELADIADKQGCQVVLQVRTGDFLHTGIALAELCHSEPDDALVTAIRDCFTLGASRTPQQDPQFLIDELVEIGLRALSPGINDPFTAITALHWLGAATAELGRRSLRKDLCGDDRADCPVIPLPDDFRHYLCRGFGAIRSAVATSPIAAAVMLEALSNTGGQIADPGRRAALRREARNLVEQARTALSGPALDEVEASYATFVETFPAQLDPRQISEREGL